jgi:hypothetical protein
MFMIAEVDEIFPVFMLWRSTIRNIVNLSVYKNESCIVCFVTNAQLVSCFKQSVLTTKLSRIWGSHGGEYEDGCLLGCSAV